MDSLLNLGFAFVHLFPYGTAQVNPFAIPQVVQTARVATSVDSRQHYLRSIKGDQPCGLNRAVQS